MDIVRLFIDQNKNLQLIINRWLFGVFLLIVGLRWFLLRDRFGAEGFEIDEASIGIGNSRLTIKPNHNDMQIAYKLWVELSTRKIGLPIDFDNDVIMEIYDSWYEFFGITRELIKEIPVAKVRRSKSTRDVVDVMVRVLNQGLRPHLTKWQAKFRKWYLIEIDKKENKVLAPQEIQKKFPEYDDLVSDMKIVNSRMNEYRQILRDLAFGE